MPGSDSTGHMSDRRVCCRICQLLPVALSQPEPRVRKGGVMKVSELKTEMDAQFARVDERFGGVDQQFAALERRIDTMEERILHRFDVVMEQVRPYMKLTFETIATMDGRMARFMATNAKEHTHLDSEHDAQRRSLERES